MTTSAMTIIAAKMGRSMQISASLRFRERYPESGRNSEGILYLSHSTEPLRAIRRHTYVETTNRDALDRHDLCAGERYLSPAVGNFRAESRECAGKPLAGKAAGVAHIPIF